MPEPKFTFEVKPGSLKRVLDDIATQSGSAYRSDDGVIPALKSPGVSGYMTLHEAVVRAIAGTGISVVSVSRGQIRLAAPQAGEADIIVTARRAAFKENISSAATRTATPPRQTPAIIDTVTADVLESRNSYSLGDALRNIPGAIFQAAGAPNQVRFGASSTNGVTFTDGLRNGSLSDNLPTPLVDSIEVVKGPASILTGTSVGGGLVNFVPKRANGVAPTEIMLGYGTGRETIASGDVSYKLPIKNLYFRVIAFAQHAAQNPAGGNEPYQYVITPMLGYRGDNTTLDLSFQYSNQRVPFTRRSYFPTTPVVGQQFVQLIQSGPVQSLAGLYNPDALIRIEYKQVGYNAEQVLADSGGFQLKLRARGLYQDGKKEIAASAVSRANANGTFTVVGISQYAPEWTTSHAADLYAKFSTGQLEHQLIIGGDFNYRKFGRAAGAVVDPALTLSQQARIAPIPYTGVRSDERYRQYGVFIQDQINWGRLHLLLGARQSWYHSTTQSAPTVAIKVVDTQKWTPTAGAVFDVTKWGSVYGSYTQSYTPQNATTVTHTGDPLPPTLGKRYEGGIKLGLFGDKLDVNAAIFWLNTDNEARIDIEHPTYSVPGPGRKTHGFEISATGAISPTLKVTAGYTHTTGILINGDPLDQSPTNVANVWVVKSIPVGERSGFDLGLGGNYFDGFYLGSHNSYVYFGRKNISLDGSIAYHINKLRLNLTVSNILDRKNYALSGAAFQLEDAPPRVVRLVVSTKF
ncbi:TonB-dependent siderophore receptor [Sphingomonas sp.]|uniref:TonB-dependent siderophore receptor n=1 Tax=Sphingomonas sp. TaxID=28214 RepID=UPI003D6C8FBA